MKVSILDDYFDTLRHLPSFGKMADHDVTIWNDQVQDVDILAERLKDAEVLCLIRERTHIREALIARLPNLKLISQRSVYPHIDVDACTKNGILLCSDTRPGRPSFATPELTWALLLAAARILPQQMAALKKGIWGTGVGNTVNGKVLGIYGYGRIGKTVAGYGKAFGMKVVIWASEKSRAAAKADGYDVAASKQAFFENCDFITLHLRLVDATRGIVTAKDLAQMKSTATLINTSRAGLVETGALVTALKAGNPGMAAVDVYDEEPLRNANDPLLMLDNVVATPHMGYVTKEELDNHFNGIFDQVNAFASGDPINVINKDVLG